MKTKIFELWNTVFGEYEEKPVLTGYFPDGIGKKSAVVIFPGGAYSGRADYEGKDYAEFLADNGIASFVVDYRVFPHHFPIQLADARRAVQYVRHYADKFGIDKDKIAVMGSSAGGHLAALTSTYYEDISIDSPDEIDKECFIPNAQILCYPVIKLLGKGVAHLGSGKNLLGDRRLKWARHSAPTL